MKITKDFKFAFSVPEAPEVPGETKVFWIVYANIIIRK